MKKDLEFEWLRRFLTISQEESFSKAAQLLNCSQPTLSRQMRDLEDFFGVELLKRTTNNVQLTMDGEFFRMRAEEILKLVDNTCEILCPTGAQLRGNLVLGGAETTGMNFLMDVFAKMKRDYPYVNLHIVSGDAPAIQEKLDQEIIHLALMINPKQVKRFEYLDLKRQDRFGLLVPKDDALAQTKELLLTEAVKLPLIFPARMYEESRYSGWNGIRYEDLNVVGSYNLVTNTTYMVEQGLGYAVTIEGLVNTQGRNLAFVPFAKDVAAKHFLVMKKHKGKMPCADVFMRYLKKELEGVKEHE